MPRVRPPLLSCVQCKKSHECAFGQDKHNAITCKSQIPFGTDESCYTRFGLGKIFHLICIQWNLQLMKYFRNWIKISQDEGGWAERGCTLDEKKMTDPMETDENVNYCHKSGCNNGNILYSHCLSCKSNLKGECALLSDPDSHVAQCKGIYSHEQRGCYTLTKSA